MKAHQLVVATFPVLLTILAGCSVEAEDSDPGMVEGASTKTAPAGYQLCRVERGTSVAPTVLRSVKYTANAFANTKGFSVPAGGVSMFTCDTILAEHGMVTKVSSFQDLKDVPYSALAARGIFTAAEVKSIKASIAAYVPPTDDPQAAGRWNFHDSLGLAQSRVNDLIEFLNGSHGAAGACNDDKGWHLTQFPNPNQYGFTCHELKGALTLVKCPSTPTTDWAAVPHASAATCPAPVAASSSGAPVSEAGTVGGVKILRNGCYFEFRNTAASSASVTAQWTVDRGQWEGTTSNKGPSCNASLGAGKSSWCSASGTVGRAVTLTVNGLQFSIPGGC